MKQEHAIFESGKQSIKLPVPVYINESASVVGKKEKEGPLGELFDVTSEDDHYGMQSWEDAESELQRIAVSKVLEKSGMQREEIRYLFAGDLLGQGIATSFGIKDFDIPLFGLYGACSTCGEALSLGAMAIAGGFAQNVICVTSSHFASAEKEFRFPLEYGGQRPPSSTWTVTGSGAFLLSANKDDKARAVITGITTGKIVDYGIHDSFNMGCAMAPAAANVVSTNLKDFNRSAEEYDQIITGDLGVFGRDALLDLLQEENIVIGERYMDCGIEMYQSSKQETGAGGSGCGCSASVLSAYILPKLERGEWNKILFIPTGALLSKTSYNEGKNIPGIAHGIVIEAIR